MSGVVLAILKLIDLDMGLFKWYLPMLASELLPADKELQDALDQFTDSRLRDQWLVMKAIELRPIIMPLGACDFCFNFWLSFLFGIIIVFLFFGFTWKVIPFHFLYVGFQVFFFRIIQSKR